MAKELGQSSAEKTRFDAFISYSREASGPAVAALHPAIERTAKPWYRKRSCRVFHDDSVMSAEASLSGTIVAALSEARWLILIASPGAAQSQWVNLETEWWIKHKSAEQIILVHSGGHISWDAQAEDFTAVTDAIPPALRGAFETEPRWVDLTWFKGDDPSSVDDARFVDVVHQIAAPILGVDRDEIGGLAAKQYRKTRRTASAALASLATLLVAAIVAASIAVINANEVRAQLRRSTSQQLAAQSQTLRKTDLATAKQLAVGAYRLDDNSQTRAALLGAALQSTDLDQTIDLPFKAELVTAMPGGIVYLIGAKDGHIALVNIETQSVTDLGTFGLSSTPRCLSGTPDGKVVLVCSYEDDEMVARVFRDEKPVQSVRGSDLAGTVTPGGDVFVATSVYQDGSTDVQRIDSDSGDVELVITLPEVHPKGMTTVEGNVMLTFELMGASDCFVEVDVNSEELASIGVVEVPDDTFMVSREPIYPSLDVTGQSYVSLNVTDEDWVLDVGRATGSVAGQASEATCWDLFDTPQNAQPAERITIPQKPYAMSVAPDTSVVAVSDGDALNVYRPGRQGRPQEVVATFKGAGHMGQGQLFMPDASRVVGFGQSTVSLWGLESTEGLVSQIEIIRSEDALKETYCTACSAGTPMLSPQGRVVVVQAWQGNTSIWFDTESGETLEFPGTIYRWTSPTSAEALTPDGDRVSIEDGKVVELEPGAPAKDPDEGLSIGAGYRADGTPGEGFTVTGGKPAASFQLSSLVVPAVSPDGTLIASVSDDHRMVLTDLLTFSEVAQIDVAGDFVKKGALGFAEDGSYIAFDQWNTNNNSIVTLVSLDPSEWLESACDSASGPLSEEVLSKFIPGSPLSIQTCS